MFEISAAQQAREAFTTAGISNDLPEEVAATYARYDHLLAARRELERAATERLDVASIAGPKDAHELVAHAVQERAHHEAIRPATAPLLQRAEQLAIGQVRQHSNTLIELINSSLVPAGQRLVEITQQLVGYTEGDMAAASEPIRRAWLEHPDVTRQVRDLMRCREALAKAGVTLSTGMNTTTLGKQIEFVSRYATIPADTVITRAALSYCHQYAREGAWADLGQQAELKLPTLDEQQAAITRIEHALADEQCQEYDNSLTARRDRAKADGIRRSLQQLNIR